MDSGGLNPGRSRPMPLSVLSASLGADVALNNTANYFDGPSVATGAAGTWDVSATITLQDTAGAATFHVKLWDGTTVIASCTLQSVGINSTLCAALSGVIAAPAGNLRMSAKDVTSVSGKILFSQSGNAKDSTITARRIRA